MRRRKTSVGMRFGSEIELNNYMQGKPRPSRKQIVASMAERIARHAEWRITQRKFRNKKTGEIVTQFPILNIRDFEEVR